MNFTVAQKETIKVGKKKVIESPNGNFLTVFEDDKSTGYFYAADISQGGLVIRDAVHIYNVKNVTDRKKPSEVEIAWSNDGTISILLINGYPHAIADFARKRAYCRTGFPPKNNGSEWSQNGHEWDQNYYDQITSIE